MKNILDVEKINKSFAETVVLDNITFSVSKGEFVVIMGQSGSGKSTLLYNISGMDHPNSGKIELNQQEFTHLTDGESSAVRLKQMGFIFQHSYLLKNLSIGDNIILPALKAKKLSHAEIKQRADDLMKMTDILAVANHDITEVSGGQLQRAAICRALINDPDIIFGDEPTGSLNSSATKEILAILDAINRNGTTLILVTHDAKVAVHAHRIIYLMDGKIHKQLILGSYPQSAEKQAQRQHKVDQWLMEQGF